MHPHLPPQRTLLHARAVRQQGGRDQLVPEAAADELDVRVVDVDSADEGFERGDPWVGGCLVGA